MKTSRRALLRGAGAAAVAGASAWLAGPVLSALANAPDSKEGSKGSQDEYFVFIQAAGGWDVTLWSDPRNEKKGIVDPATTDNLDSTLLRRWREAPFSGGTSSTRTFEIVTPKGTPFRLGPALGELLDLADRLTIVNGLEMNTVSHPDGTIFSATGRHPVGGRAVASSVDTMIAAELGAGQLIPTLSVGFPSYFVGDGLDRRAVPLRVGSVGAVTRLLARSEAYESTADRQAITAVLSEEARDLSKRCASPELTDGLAVQYDALQKMIGGSLDAVFSVPVLQKAHPRFDYQGKFAGQAAVSAAFAIEAMRRNLVRCVSFASTGFDTHTNNYRSHGAALQELFDLVAVLVRALDAVPHPTRTGDKLSDHTHILVVSEFCRTPQINQASGRDHYPNNSALVVSPRFRHPFAIGQTDAEQLLPAPIPGFAGGPRPIAPPDLLATFVRAFGVDPRRHLRDGEVVEALLST